MSKLHCLQVTVSCSNDFVSFVNETVFGLGISYIAAYIVYFLTVLIPKSEQMKPILMIMHEQIRYAKDEMYDLINSICGFSNVCDSNAFFQKIQLEQTGDCYTIKEDSSKEITTSLKHIKEHLQYSLAKIEYLESFDIQRISNFCSISTNLITKLDDGLLLSKEQIEQIRKDIVSLYTCLQNIEENISFMCNIKK